MATAESPGDRPEDRESLLTLLGPAGALRPAPAASPADDPASLLAVAGSYAFVTTAHDPAPRGVILLAGGDFLGLGTHPLVREEAVRATHRYGWGAGAGDARDPWHAAHEELERRLAARAGCETSLLYPGRYGALVVTLSALLAPGDVLLLDAPGNAALAEGGRLARARVETFRHGDPEDLAARLGRRDEGTRVVVAVEGVYGLTGGLAPLDGYQALCREHGALLLVDDTYGQGVAGPTGRGSAEARGLLGEVDFVAGCLGRMCGGTGAFVAGPSGLLDALRGYARARQDSQPPPVAASLAALCALRVLDTEPEPRHRLWRNICSLREGLRLRGYDVRGVDSALVPIPVGDERLLREMKSFLLQHGLYAAHLAPPQVEPALARLRLSVKANLTEEDVNRAAEVLGEAGHRFGVCG